MPAFAPLFGGITDIKRASQRPDLCVHALNSFTLLGLSHLYVYAAMSPPAALPRSTANSSGSCSGARGWPSFGSRFGIPTPAVWVPALERASVVERRAKFHARLAQSCALRATHHRAPARSRASRTNRCAGLHLPPWILARWQSASRDTKPSGTPGLTPRCLRIAPLNADAPTGARRRTGLFTVNATVRVAHPVC
jgi:hypothetical protein